MSKLHSSIRYRFAKLSGMAALLAVSLASTPARAVMYAEGWEDRRVNKNSLSLDGGCYRRFRHGYDSFSVSTRHARTGNAALRIELHGDDKNQICDLRRLVRERKSRSEMRHARSINALDTIKMGSEIWMGMSLYIPSNEGTFKSWWRKSERIIVAQLMGGGNSATPEIHFMLQGGKLVIEQAYSTEKSRERLRKVTDSVSIKPDQWIDVVVNWKRSWQKDGFRTVWVNGQKVVDRRGPSAIRNKPYAYIKQGAYFGRDVRREKYVLYVDSIKIGNGSSSYSDVSPVGGGAKSRPAASTLTVR